MRSFSLGDHLTITNRGLSRPRAPVEHPTRHPHTHHVVRPSLRRPLLAAGAPAGSVVLLQGGASETRHETDHECLFRQESFFHWAFGVREPDCAGAIAVSTGAATLFIPRLDESYAVVMGAIRAPGEWRALYGVEAVAFGDEIAATLRALVGAAVGAEAAGGRRGAPTSARSVAALSSPKATASTPYSAPHARPRCCATSRR
ncbi:putative hydrolase [Perkinsus sp. BL_2016]|nr:putative hydrolase [Perkinsus sp. BL_2016]